MIMTMNKTDLEISHNQVKNELGINEGWISHYIGNKINMYCMCTKSSSKKFL